MHSLFDTHICLFDTYVQAWAMACYVRKILGFFPTMCIRNFPPEAFKLHRKLVRKFIRHKKHFAKATEELPEYID